ncbi:hypothetical protein [Mesorhizobium australicum]|uniref:hypothetical protein n=1 Tax=Mesorhizobium australicum TaxID=536018 RepID=UPI00333C7EDF
MANDTKYRRFVIKSMKVSGEWNARAFRAETTVGGKRSGPTEQAAILAVKEELDLLQSEQRALRIGGYPTVNEVRAAFDAISITSEQQAMLNAHCQAVDHIMTATELAHAGGYDSYVSANSQYGGLGRKLAEELEWVPPMNKKGVPTWTFALATGADENGSTSPDRMDEHWRWKLRQEVVEACNADPTY